MKLYLVRHGESTPEKSLSPKGIAETGYVAHLLKEAGVEIDEIIHSEKPRATQTAQIIGEIAAPDLTLITHPGLKPNDPIEPLLPEIFTLDHALMIVSHLPFLEKLLTRLVLGHQAVSPVDLSSSCVICLEGSGEFWIISWVISPKLKS